MESGHAAARRPSSRRHRRDDENGDNGVSMKTTTTTTAAAAAAAALFLVFSISMWGSSVVVSAASWSPSTTTTSSSSSSRGPRSTSTFPALLLRTRHPRPPPSTTSCQSGGGGSGRGSTVAPPSIIVASSLCRVRRGGHADYIGDDDDDEDDFDAVPTTSTSWERPSEASSSSVGEGGGPPPPPLPGYPNRRNDQQRQQKQQQQERPGLPQSSPSSPWDVRQQQQQQQGHSQRQRQRQGPPGVGGGGGSGGGGVGGGGVQYHPSTSQQQQHHHPRQQQQHQANDQWGQDPHYPPQSQPPPQQAGGQHPAAQHHDQRWHPPPHPQQPPPPPWQQQQQRRRDVSPPDLPPGYDGRHPSGRVLNAHSRGGLPSSPPPRGFTPDDGDDRAGGGVDEEDDWLLPSSSAIAAADGEFEGKNDDDDPDEGGGEGPGSVGGGGSPDLSQFDKDVIFNGLKRLYRKKIRPLELSSRYGHFHSPPLMPSDFDSKPMVLLLGQYSVGKTSFIRYLLGRDFPGQRIGPEPTTDRFVAIIKGDSSGGENSGDKIIPGAALCSQADRPFRGLSMFGNNFLSRFEGVEMYDCPILNNITLVDTPGILSGQKQGQYGRNYDYEQVMKWFAERADLIIIMFDAHKLDISDELKRVIELLRPHQDKVRVLLNKADAISTQQLMRVYGALMWSLGKVMLTPEVCRVYMGSFWGAPLKNKEQAALLNREKRDLFDDIARLPQDAVMRRINELVKRARSVKVHAYIMHYLRKQLPYTWGKREKQRRLIDRLDREFVMCARRYELPRGDFPELETFRRALLEMKDISSEVHKLDKKMVKEMERVFSVDIPNLLEAAKFH